MPLYGWGGAEGAGGGGRRNAWNRRRRQARLQAGGRLGPAAARPRLRRSPPPAGGAGPYCRTVRTPAGDGRFCCRPGDDSGRPRPGLGDVGAGRRHRAMFGLGFCECDFCQQIRLRSGIRLMLSPLTLPRRQPPLPIKASCPFRVF